MKKSPRRDLNSRPLVYKTSALTPELRRLLCKRLFRVHHSKYALFVSNVKNHLLLKRINLFRTSAYFYHYITHFPKTTSDLIVICLLILSTLP